MNTQQPPATFIGRVIGAGASNLPLHQARWIRLVNSMCLLGCAIALVFGMLLAVEGEALLSAFSGLLAVTSVIALAVNATNRTHLGYIAFFTQGLLALAGFMVIVGGQTGAHFFVVPLCTLLWLTNPSEKTLALVPPTVACGVLFAAGEWWTTGLHSIVPSVGTVVREASLWSMFAAQVGIVWVFARLANDAQRRLHVLATTDELTQLLNRRQFTTLAEAEQLRARQQDGSAALVAFDIDHFKRINDTYGHHIGDRVLVLVAQRIREATRSGDVAGRIGGEEFAIVLPGADMRGALCVAERLRLAVAESVFEVDTRRITVTVSVGVTQLCRSETGIGAALQRADKALYLAKNSGRNCTRKVVALEAVGSRRSVSTPGATASVATPAILVAAHSVSPAAGG